MNKKLSDKSTFNIKNFLYLNLYKSFLNIFSIYPHNCLFFKPKEWQMYSDQLIFVIYPSFITIYSLK